MVFKLLFILLAFPKAIHDLLNKNSLITILLVLLALVKNVFYQQNMHLTAYKIESSIKIF